MATMFEARNAIAERFFQAWEDSSGPGGYRTRFHLEGKDGIEFSPPKDEAWVRISIRFFTGEKRSIGRVGNGVRLDRHGQLYVQVFAPVSQGVKKADELTQAALDGLEGRIIPSIGEFLVGQQHYIGEDKDFYQVNVEIPFIWRDKR